MFLVPSSSTKKTHYDILSVTEDASYDEIRARYRAAVLDSHPDKLQTKPEVSEPQDKFLDVQKAWEVLSNPTSRANYDKELRASRHELDVSADEVHLEEMSVEGFDDSKEYFYECRCGDHFSVSATDLARMGISFDENAGEIGLHSAAGIVPASILLPCGSCSLKIRLILDVNC